MKPRILLATDIPFWRASNGAEQRILSLAKHMHHTADVRVFCIAPPAGLNDRDRESVKQFGFSVDFRSSEQPPRAWPRKLSWYASAVMHQWRKAGADHDLENKHSDGLRLEDFRWPWAIEALADLIRQQRPDFLIVEYVKLAYLLEALPRVGGKRPQTILDTHDVLHLRQQQFEARQQEHWIKLSASEEAKAASQFDVIMAIEPGEAAWFQDAIPNQRVIVCPHGFADQDLTLGREPTAGFAEASRALRLGYLGSDNASNRDALDSFIRHIWPEVLGRLGDSVELRVGGAVGEAVPRLETTRQVAVLGYIDSLSDFYHDVDVVINPVRFGTGLKIKGVEGLSFGKPLITTAAGQPGLPKAASGEAVGIFESAQEFVELLERFQDPTRYAEASASARDLAQTEYSANQAFSELDEVLFPQQGDQERV